jgi:hypothetical protein
VKLTTHLHVVPKSRMVELYLLRLSGVVFNQLIEHSRTSQKLVN